MERLCAFYGTILLLLYLSIIESHAQTPCELKDCPANTTFCREELSGEATCFTCHQSCVGCDGGTQNDCKECKIGYYVREEGDFEPCEPCQDGRYGVGCLLTCNCLNPDKCDKVNGECTDFACDRGYSNTPYCNQTCTQGSFGLDCKDECHCPPGDTCNPVNGDCHSGECHEDYIGPACSERLPRLIDSPSVQAVECGKILLKWNPFNKEDDLGEGPAGKYEILYQQQNITSKDFTLAGRIAHPENISVQMEFTVDKDLIPDATYIFRVDVVAFKNGKDSSKISKGPLSDTVFNLCTITTTPEITTPAVFSRTLFFSVTANVLNSTSIRLKWTVIPGFEVYNYNVTVEIQPLGQGDCENKLGQTRSQIHELLEDQYGTYRIDQELLFASLKPWQKYRLGVTAIGVKVDVRDSQNVTNITSPTLPSGTITGFNFSKLTEKEVEIKWDDLPCTQRGGPFKYYEIYILNLNESNGQELKYISQEKTISFNRLSAFSNYSVKGLYVNMEGSGPISETFYFMTAEEAPGPVSIDSFTSTSSTITVTFQPITMTTGILDTYTATFSLTATFDSFESKTINAGSNVNTITIQRLEPETKYYFRMFASTLTRTGSFSSVEEITTTAIPPPADQIILSLKSTTPDCLTLEWVPPPDMESQITKYQLEIKEASADTSITPILVDLTRDRRDYQQCDLKPSQLYMTEISALVGDTVVTSAKDNFITAHGTPPTPVAPILVRSSYTNITISIEPVALSDVTITAYQIIVVSLGANNSEIGQAYIAAELKPEDVPKQREFVVGDGLTYSGYTNTRLTRDLHYRISYKALSTLNNSTTESISAIATPVQAVPFDPSVAPVLDLSLSTRTTDCLTFTWALPSDQTSSISGITVSIRQTDDGSQGTTTIFKVDASARSYEKCDLLPYTLYTAVVTLTTDDGILTTASDTFRTEQETPIIPVAPTFVNSTFTTITVAIEPLILETGPVSFYQLQVEKISGSGRRKRMAGVPGYVTAQLSPSDVPRRSNFVVGDGAKYGGITNKPLEKEQTYVIHYVVVSSFNNVTKHNYSSLNPPVQAVPYKPAQLPVANDDSDDNGVLIGIIVALIVILIIIIILLLLFWWWRRKNRFSPYEIQDDEKANIPLPAFVDDYNPQKYWSAVQNLKESRRIVAGRELVYLEGQGHRRSEVGGGDAGGDNPDMPSISFRHEFTSLPHKSSRATDNAARQNSHLNRFPHLLPYDHSLVKLKPDANSRSAYVNASFIPGYKKTPAYIAAQSPYDEDTVLNFWRLIYQRSLKTVVMITNVVEDNIVKCTQYWPDHSKASFGNFLLHLTEISHFADYIIRTISIRQVGEESSRTVRLFEFTSWPDHGVPDDPIPFLEMRYKIRGFHGDEKTPILVHCGTGMARTGVFIAIDALIDQYAAEGRCMVFDYVRRIRKDRPYMVRTQKQYTFIYEAIFEEFHAGDTLVDLDLKGRYHNWTQKNPKTDQTFLRDQFSLLQKFTRGPTQEECKSALLEVNKKKNRYLDVVPSEKHRPYLMSLGGLNPSDYINAFFVDGYLKKKQFILTQTPLHTTIIDFWKLVYDYNVRTIVMVDSFKNEDDTCAEYWPGVNMKQFEPFFIETTASFQQDNITIRNFKILSTKNPKEPARFVRQFQFNAWAEPNLTPQSKTMLLDLIDNVFDWQEEACQNERPVVVHCKDGSSHSGLFASIAVCCERMEEDGEVDVYRTIKHIKRRRLQCVDEYEQFRFCYKSLWDFMNLRMSGGTFTDSLGQNRTDRKYGVASLSLNSYFDGLKMNTSEL